MGLDLGRLLSLANISAPGLNRPLGAGDVVPYFGSTPGSPQLAADTQVANPGVFNQIGGGGGVLPAGAFSAIQSALLNLSNAGLPTGKATALPSTAAATPGLTSAQIGNALQAVNAPAAGGPTPTNVQPTAGGTGAAAGGAAGGSPGGVGAPASGDTGAAASTGAAAPSGDAAGVASAGPAGAAAGEPGTGAGEAAGPGGGGGDGGAGTGSVCVTYVLKHMALPHRQAVRVNAYWLRIQRLMLEQPETTVLFRRYQALARRLTAWLDSHPMERHEALVFLYHQVVVGHERRATAADLVPAIERISTACAALSLLKEEAEA